MDYPFSASVRRMLYEFREAVEQVAGRDHEHSPNDANAITGFEPRQLGLGSVGSDASGPLHP
jgi:hypothetical protein